MIASTHLLTEIFVILIVLGLLWAIIYVMRLVFRLQGIKEEDSRKILAFIAIGFGFWLAILSLLAAIGFFSQFATFPPRLLLVMVPPVALILYLLLSPGFGRVLQLIPPPWLIWVQSFRILVEITLWLGFKAGIVPQQMTFEWLSYDIIVGATAIMGGYLFYWRGRFRQLETFIWNFFGIILLLNVVLIAVLSTPSPYRVFMNEPTSVFLSRFPFIWIPGFIVPFALAMHLFSLRQMFIWNALKRSVK